MNHCNLRAKDRQPYWNHAYGGIYMVIMQSVWSSSHYSYCGEEHAPGSVCCQQREVSREFVGFPSRLGNTCPVRSSLSHSLPLSSSILYPTATPSVSTHTLPSAYLRMATTNVNFREIGQKYPNLNSELDYLIAQFKYISSLQPLVPLSLS